MKSWIEGLTLSPDVTTRWGVLVAPVEAVLGTPSAIPAIVCYVLSLVLSSTYINAPYAETEQHELSNTYQAGQAKYQSLTALRDVPILLSCVDVMPVKTTQCQALEIQSCLALTSINNTKDCKKQSRYLSASIRHRHVCCKKAQSSRTLTYRII